MSPVHPFLIRLFLGFNAMWLCAFGNEPDPVFRHYTCLSDHLNLEAYESGQDTTITFSEDGIIMKQGRYHPVQTAIYGLLCYDRFVETGDSGYYYKLVHQAGYFMDPQNSRSAFGGKGLGYPYEFEFHGLKPPWYSAMAQGMAISLLLRYQSLTGDKDAGTWCRKLAYFMMQPDSLGGTLGRFEDGSPWLEEYPLSDRAPQVLNGSINAWIGLHEYCQVFKREKEARMLRDSLLQAFEDHLDNYTLSWWSRYDQGQRACSPSYLRYHVYQMRHLYELTGREAFRIQEALWASFLSGKPLEPGDLFSNRDYQMAISAVYRDHGWCMPEYDLVPEVGPDRAGAASYTFRTLEELGAFIETGAFSPEDESNDGDRKVMMMHFDRPIHADYITMEFATRGEGLTAEVFALTRENELVPLPLFQDWAGVGVWRAQIRGEVPALGYNRLVVVFSGTRAGTITKVKTGLYDTRGFVLPQYGFFRSAPVSMRAGERFRIMVPSRMVDEILIFYRHAPLATHVANEFFSRKAMVAPDGIVEAPESGAYQFLVVYRVRNILSLTRMLRYEKLE